MLVLFSIHTYFLSCSLREEAAQLTEERRSYTFDIDAMEGDEPNPPGNPEDIPKYSVEAYSCGMKS